MNDKMVIFVLFLFILFLLGIVLYQQFAFRTGTQRKLREIHIQLKKILDAEGDESLMIFTENKEFMELAAQINRLLEKQRKTRADYRRYELAAKRMLSNISHDMKTPMTVILGYLEIMRIDGEASPEMLVKTQQKAQSLMELINQFFTLAKLEAGDTELELSRLDICELCRENILDFYEMLSEADFQVEVDVPETAVYIQGNKEALHRILTNLLSNVIRYGSEGRYLGIFLNTDEENVYLEVVDKGPGIDKAFSKRVFDRLFTMEDSRSRKVQGNGLGLTIAKNLAWQMGGDILLDSTSHVRSTFTVKLRRIFC